MFIETITQPPGLLNVERITGVQVTQQGDTYTVNAEVVVQHGSRNSLRPIYRGDQEGMQAFMTELTGALPMLPIGKYKPKRTTKTTTKTTAASKAKTTGK